MIECKEKPEWANLTPEMFPTICRLCLASENLKNIQNIFEENSNLGALLTSFGYPEVKNDDHLPQNICIACIEKLNDINNLIGEYQSAYEALVAIQEGSPKFQGEHDYCELFKADSSNESDLKIVQVFQAKNDTKATNKETVKYVEIKLEDGKEIGEVIRELDLPEDSPLLKDDNCETIKIECETDISDCNRSPKSKKKKALKSHKMTIVDGTKIITCEYCPATFTNYSNFLRHKYVHFPEKPHKCTFCDKSFTRKESLKIHLKYHTGENHHTCEHCGKQFTTISNYNRHVQQHQLVNGELAPEEANKVLKSITCELCGKLFSSKHTLRTHMLLHQPKHFTCEICGKKFTFLGNLRSHYRSHTGERPFQCPHCPKSFSFKNSLKEHIYTHTGERPHTCEFCNKGFAQHQQLKTHLRTHTGERPFTCSFCKKTFANKVNMTVHTRIHTGEMPFMCAVCGKGYYDSSSLKKHKKRHEEKVET